MVNGTRRATVFVVIACRLQLTRFQNGLVSSSISSGTPSVRVRICSSRASGSALLSASDETIAALWVGVGFQKFNVLEMSLFFNQRDRNPGW